MGRKRYSNDFTDLRGRWSDNKKVVSQILSDATQGNDWTRRLKNFLAEDSAAVAPLLDGMQFPPDLRHFNLEKRDLTDVKFASANMEGTTAFRAQGPIQCVSCNLTRTRWQRSQLRGAKFIDCDLGQASFSSVDLSDADFTGSRLRYVSFRRAKLQGAKLDGTDLNHANLTEADCQGATFTGARVYGASLWGLTGEPADQSNLVITPRHAPMITVDNLKVAQFVYLLLNNQEIREVLDTITSKVVLILGRFTDSRMPLLQQMREELRKLNYIPVLFDFDKPQSRDTVETVRTIASMSRFVVADLTDAKSVLQELQAIVPDLPSLPVQPIIEHTQEEPGMFDHIRNLGRDRVLPTISYASASELLGNLASLVIAPVHEKSDQLRRGH